MPLLAGERIPQPAAAGRQRQRQGHSHGRDGREDGERPEGLCDGGL